MKKYTPVILAIAGALAFELLFYQHFPGLNIGVFTVYAIVCVYLILPREQRKTAQLLSATAVLSLSLAFSWHGNWYTLFVFFLTYAIWMGSLAAAGVGLIPAFPTEALFSAFTSQYEFYHAFEGSKRFRTRNWRWIIFSVLFVVVVILFIKLYGAGNVIFQNFASGLTDWIARVFENISLGAFMVFVMGLLFSNWFVFHQGDQDHADRWNRRNLLLDRNEKRPSVFSGLRQNLLFEYRSGLLLFVSLNLLLLLLNISDVYLVWFGFEWKGQLLKDFVHEGTWNLLLSILIASGIMLFYFRRNQNFIRKPWLRRLAFLWIAQNVFLAFSLILRNWHYIENYGLAYRRIGIYFFLAAVFAMLAFLLIKILRKENGLMFLQRNSVAALIILTISALPDWSLIITQWNFSHYRQSYVHTAFLSEMPDRCLPVFLSFQDQLPEIEQQQSKLGFKYDSRVDGIPMDTFLMQRIEAFRAEYGKKGWQEKTMADEMAYRSLSHKTGK